MAVASNLQELITAIDNDMGTLTVAFGKHKGRMVRDVPKDYIKWARRTLEREGTNNKGTAVTRQEYDPQAIARTQELEKDGEWLCPRCNTKNYLVEKCKSCRMKIDIKSPLVKGNSMPNENGEILELRGYYEILAKLEEKKAEQNQRGQRYRPKTPSGNRGAGRTSYQASEAIRRILRGSD